MASAAKAKLEGAFTPDTGLKKQAYKKVAEALGPVLAESYQLFIKRRASIGMCLAPISSGCTS